MTDPDAAAAARLIALRDHWRARQQHLFGGELCDAADELDYCLVDLEDLITALRCPPPLEEKK